VAYDSAAPLLNSNGKRVTYDKLVLTYNEPLDTRSVPDYVYFTVLEEGSPITVSGVNVSGSAVALTLVRAVVYGKNVTVSYNVPGTNPVKDLVGNAAGAFAGQTVLQYGMEPPASTSTTSSSSSGSTTTTSTTTTTTAPVSLSTATTASTSTVNGQTVATVAVDEAKAIAVLNANPNAKVFNVDVNQTAAVAKAEVPGGIITALIKQGAAVEVKAAAGEYTLPAAEIKVSELAKLLGAKDADVKITIVIAEAKTEQASAVQKAAAAKGLTQLAAPVEFKVEAVAAGKTVEVNNFSSYVSREINLPKAIDAAAAVGVVLNADGTLSPVPTQFKTVDGKTVAVIKRKSNSVYTVVENKRPLPM
jgi:uncharacterized repeat protein (TIGR02059 family)